MMKNTFFFFLLVKVPVAIIIVPSVGKDGEKNGRDKKERENEWCRNGKIPIAIWDVIEDQKKKNL